MVTTDMDMVMARPLKYSIYFISIFICHLCVASELIITPTIKLEELYSDNVELQQNNTDSSLVTLLSPGVNVSLLSSRVELNLEYQLTQAWYSHDHSLDDDFTTTKLSSRIKLFPSGLDFVANGSIQNISTNNARNALADIASGDTTESKNYQLGFEYNTESSSFIINSQIMFSETENGDDLGNRDGYTAKFNSFNGNNSRYVFWDFLSNYSEYSDRQQEGRYYTLDSKVGLITSFKFNPFIRYYDEEISGTLNQQNIQNTTSLGAGFRWLMAQHFYLDVAYNWADENSPNDNISEEENDDYMSAAISWQPSPRTSLDARLYNKFNNEAYQLNFNHKLRRLTTSISYNESVQLLERTELAEVNYQDVWCLTAAPEDISQCLLTPTLTTDLNEYFVRETITQLIPIESDSFVLNKVLSSTINYQAKRTNYQLTVSNNKRDNLEFNSADISDSIAIRATRKISRQTTGNLSFSLNKNEFGEGSTQTLRQTDYYHVYTASLENKIFQTVGITYLFQHLNRNSSSNQTYKENRLSISLAKEF